MGPLKAVPRQVPDSSSASINLSPALLLSLFVLKMRPTMCGSGRAGNSLRKLLECLLERGTVPAGWPGGGGGERSALDVPPALTCPERSHSWSKSTYSSSLLNMPRPNLRGFSSASRRNLSLHRLSKSLARWRLTWGGGGGRHGVAEPGASEGRRRSPVFLGRCTCLSDFWKYPPPSLIGVN